MDTECEVFYSDSKPREKYAFIHHYHFFFCFVLQTKDTAKQTAEAKVEAKKTAEAKAKAKNTAETKAKPTNYSAAEADTHKYNNRLRFSQLQVYQNRL